MFLEWVKKQDLLRLVEGADIPAELVVQAQNGSEEARDEIGIRVRSLALKFLLGHQMPQIDAEDIAGETVLVILKKLDDHEKTFSDPDQVDRYTMQVAKRLRAMHFRIKAKYLPTTLGNVDDDPMNLKDKSYVQDYMGAEHEPEGLEKMVRDEDRALLKKALEQLKAIKPQYYELIMHYLDDPTNKAVAKAMGFHSPNQVKGMLFRAQAKLRELMGVEESFSDEYFNLLLESLVS